VPDHIIEDPDDPRLAEYRNVPDPELLERHGVFVAEGRLVVRRLLEGRRFPARSVMVTEPARAVLGDALDGSPDLPVYVVSLSLMTMVTGFDIHRGCLAIGERTPAADWRTVVERAACVVVLERVANADNVGGVFRNAAAFGADAVLIGPSCIDPLYRKAIRTSMGAALSVPFARAEPWPDALAGLRERGFQVIGLTPAASAAPLHDAAARAATQPVALVLGHEGDGLTAGALSRCTTTARIPMAGGVDSLNVATAAAVALYEWRRQSSNQSNIHDQRSEFEIPDP
jgi:tRNA G18 (ribose-2'-O)-methylase SpoU